MSWLGTKASLPWDVCFAEAATSVLGPKQSLRLLRSGHSDAFLTAYRSGTHVNTTIFRSAHGVFLACCRPACSEGSYRQVIRINACLQ